MEGFVGLIVLIGFVWTGVAYSDWSKAPSASAFIFVVVGVALIVAPSYFLWRRDSVGTAKFLGLCSGVPGAITLIWALTGDDPRRAWTLVAVFGVPAIASAAYVFREWKRPEVLPNVLLQWARHNAICEVEGLQLVGQLVRGSNPDAPFELRFAVQSCVDADRTLTITLSGVLASRLRYRKETSVTVAPGVVGILSLPLAPISGPEEPGTLYFEPVVWGSWGARVRYWRARGYEPPVGRVSQVALLALGTLAWGGGWCVNVPGPPDGREATGPLPADRWEVKWTPEPANLAAARRP
jgi:hypothetical protein